MGSSLQAILASRAVQACVVHNLESGCDFLSLFLSIPHTICCHSTHLTSSAVTACPSQHASAVTACPSHHLLSQRSRHIIYCHGMPLTSSTVTALPSHHLLSRRAPHIIYCICGCAQNSTQCNLFNTKFKGPMKNVHFTRISC